MLLFIAVVATLNLCIGYAAGVYLGQMPGLPSLPRRKPVDPPEPAVSLDGATQKKPKPKKSKAKKPPAEETPEPAEEPTASAPSAPSAEEVMDSMAAFQAQLAKMGAEMQASVEDEEAFGECADRLQQANHDYLEQAHQTIEDIDGDEGCDAAGCRDVLAENAKRVGESSEEIDTLLADGVPDEEQRAELIEKTTDLERIVEAAEQAIEAQVEGVDEPNEPASKPAAPEAAAAKEAPLEQTADAAEGNGVADEEADEEGSAKDAPAEAPAQEPPAGEEGVEQEEPAPAAEAEAPALAPLAVAEKAIEAAISEEHSELVVALLQRDPVDVPNGVDEETIEKRMLAAIAEVATECLGASQIVAPQDDNRLLMILADDTIEEATVRIERMRQQIEQTRFKAGGESISATATFALTETIEVESLDGVLEHLGEALGEQETHGSNRTYHHDGRYPAPVLPEEVDVTPKTVAV